MCSSACIEFGRANLGPEDVRGKAVLEVGSLSVKGSLRSVVEGLGPSEYVGIDIVPGPGVDEVCAAEHVSKRFGAERFDLVLEVLEHVLEWRAAITAMKEVLRPGGTALITTRSPGFPYHGFPADFWRFEPTQMEAIFGDFEVERIERDPVSPGVFLKARKPPDGKHVDLASITPIPVVRPARRSRAFTRLWRTATAGLSHLPVRLRSSRQLAREALAAGAIQKVSELAGLAALLRPRRLTAVLEIGSYRGGTLGLWCKLAEPDATIAAIDLPAEYGTPEETEALRALALNRQRLEILRADSHADRTRVELERLLGGRPLDFVMIDGDHSYEGVRRDFELYSPLVRDGGLIAFHDILPHPKMPGIEVDRFWSEIRDLYEHMEFLEQRNQQGFGQWGGIGVLHYRRA